MSLSVTARSLLRVTRPSTLRPCVGVLPTQPVHSVRTYAKKSKKSKPNRQSKNQEDEEDDDEDTAAVETVVKGKGRRRGGVSSDEMLEDTDAKAKQVMEKMDAKFAKAFTWFKAKAYDGVERGTGRVTPAVLDSVKVNLPDYDSPEPLINVASVVVRQNALWVEVFDDAVSFLFLSKVDHAVLDCLYAHPFVNES